MTCWLVSLLTTARQVVWTIRSSLEAQQIDAGVDELCTDSDHLGQARADGIGDGVATCDIGAFEFVGMESL